MRMGTLRRDSGRVHEALMWARGYTIGHTQGGVYFDGPFRNQRLDRRLWLWIAEHFMRSRGYVMHCSAVGRPHFDGPYDNLRLGRRVLLALYEVHMRRRGYTMCHTQGGVYFQGSWNQEDQPQTLLDRFMAHRLSNHSSDGEAAS